MHPGSPEFIAVVSALAAGISALSAIVAIASLFITRKNWRDSNRPVVSAYIDEEIGGQGITVFNLYLQNSGTRPATLVQLSTKATDIQKIFAERADPSRRKEIEGIFSPESRLSVLHPNETLVTSFGLASEAAKDQWLIYGEELKVTITYRDLDGSKYRSFIFLKVRPRTGFGGGVWRSADQPSIERSDSGGRRQPSTAPHVER